MGNGATTLLLQNNEEGRNEVIRDEPRQNSMRNGVTTGLERAVGSMPSLRLPSLRRQISNTKNARTSIRTLAHRHHSRQENTYIPCDNVLSISAAHFKGISSEVPQSVSKRADEEALRPSDNVESNFSKPRIKTNLKIKIQDDTDWIQVTNCRVSLN
jgi:hypothetical protein